MRPLASLIQLAVRPAGLDGALAAITPSVLILHARDDHHVPVDYAVAAARRQPEWTLCVLEQGGHHAHVAQPTMWARAVTSWLAKTCAP